MEKDYINKRYFSDNRRYADLINGFVFHGGQEIRGDLLVEKDKAYREMDEDAFDMAVTYADAKGLISIKKLHEKEGKVDMCKALTELIADGREEGIKEGMAAGIRLTKKNIGLQAKGWRYKKLQKGWIYLLGKQMTVNGGREDGIDACGFFFGCTWDEREYGCNSASADSWADWDGRKRERRKI